MAGAPRNSAHPPQPPLKWAGGKRWLVPLLADAWQEHRSRRFVEPFCGGLAMALGLRPENARLNDSNPHLINFYEWVQRGLIFDFDFEFENEERSYYRCRSRFNSLILNGGASSVEAAALFYYLNRTGYNGLCRFNKKGLFNVPFGRHGKINYATDFLELSVTLGDWDFTAGDFQHVDLDPDDFVYADPPYDVDFTSYSAGGFGWLDQQRVAEWLATHTGPVVASNQATPRIVDLYGGLGFEIHHVEGPRRISSDGNREPALEILACRNLNRPESSRE